VFNIVILLCPCVGTSIKILENERKKSKRRSPGQPENDDSRYYYY